MFLDPVFGFSPDPSISLFDSRQFPNPKGFRFMDTNIRLDYSDKGKQFNPRCTLYKIEKEGAGTKKVPAVSSYYPDANVKDAWSVYQHDDNVLRREGKAGAPFGKIILQEVGIFDGKSPIAGEFLFDIPTDLYAKASQCIDIAVAGAVFAKDGILTNDDIDSVVNNPDFLKNLIFVRVYKMLAEPTSQSSAFRAIYPLESKGVFEKNALTRIPKSSFPPLVTPNGEVPLSGDCPSTLQ